MQITFSFKKAGRLTAVLLFFCSLCCLHQQAAVIVIQFPAECPDLLRKLLRILFPDCLCLVTPPLLSLLR